MLLPGKMIEAEEIKSFIKSIRKTEPLPPDIESSPKMKRSIIGEYSTKERVHIKDAASLKRKLMKMRKDGIEKLIVITDFDSTLTRRKQLGKSADSSFKVLTTSPLMSHKYKSSSAKMFEYYSPIEKDASMDKELKNAKMFQWWEETLKLIIDECVTKTIIRHSVKLSSLYFRDGILKLIDSFIACRVPAYIVSAGLKSIIIQSLEILSMQAALPHWEEFITVCATGEEFNSDEELVKFLPPIPTSSTKFKLITHELYPKLPRKSNAIVMGDLIDDLTMPKLLELDTILSIGFLNADEKSLTPQELQDYEDAFDIVILFDGNLLNVARIINFIAGGIFAPLPGDSEGGKTICVILKELELMLAKSGEKLAEDKAKGEEGAMNKVQVCG